jgi:putative ABC transport system permease protein
MNWIQRLWTTLFAGRRERRILEELAFHLDERIAANLEAGMTPAEARYDAEKRFGARSRLREETRDVSVLEWADTLLRDIRLSCRSLRRHPGIAATIIVSLAIGMGANSAIFSVVDGVLLKPFHIVDPGRVFALEEFRNGVSHNGSPARLADWARHASSLEAVCGFYGEGLTMTGQGTPERVRTWRTIGDPLAILGVHPVLGRGFTPRELQGLESAALLDHAFWSSRFAADPQILGKALTLGTRSFTIVGVLPEGTDYPGDTDIVIPASAEVQNSGRRASFLSQVARLKPGFAASAAQAELSTIAGRLRMLYAATDSGLEARLVPLTESATREARQPLLILLCTVGFVLLIACVNTASLLLSRASERGRESRVRVALGAGTGSLIRLYLVESLVLAAAGGLLGLALAALSLDTLIRLLPDLPRLTAIHLDLRVAGITLAVALFSGLLFGLVPALQAARSASQTDLADGVRSSAGVHRLWSRRLLVVSQIALSAILLVGVGLLAKSLLLMLRTPLGFEPAQVTTVQVNLPWDTDSAKLAAFYDRTLEALSAVPGVRTAGVIDRLPLRGGTQTGRIEVRGLTLSPDLAARTVSYRGTSEGYFAALGIPLQAGRLLRKRASEQGPREVMINDTLARQFFPDGGAVGRYIAFKSSTPVWYEVVGVVGNTRQSPSQTTPIPEAFLLMRDVYWPMANFVLRTDGNVDPAIRAVMARTNPDQVFRISTLDRELSGTVREPEVRLWLMGAFAFTALLLAAIGMYGLLASDVTQRTQEIGIRMALGADPASILKATGRRAFELVGAGLVIGGLGAIAFTRYLSSLLYIVTTRDVAAFAGAAVTLLIVAAFAAYFPARRAATIAPVIALRHE